MGMQSQRFFDVLGNILFFQHKASTVARGYWTFERVYFADGGSRFATCWIKHGVWRRWRAVSSTSLWLVCLDPLSLDYVMCILKTPSPPMHRLHIKQVSSDGLGVAFGCWPTNLQSWFHQRNSQPLFSQCPRTPQNLKKMTRRDERGSICQVPEQTMGHKH